MYNKILSSFLKLRILYMHIKPKVDEVSEIWGFVK